MKIWRMKISAIFDYRRETLRGRATKKRERERERERADLDKENFNVREENNNRVTDGGVVGVISVTATVR